MYRVTVKLEKDVQYIGNVNIHMYEELSFDQWDIRSERQADEMFQIVHNAVELVTLLAKIPVE